jgi:hypothetical protein
MKTKFYFLSLVIFLFLSGSLFAFDGNKTMIDGPTAVCMNAMAFIDFDGIALISPGEVDGGSFAEGSIDSMFVSPSSFSCFEFGPNTVTLTVIDDQGLSTTCEATVDVIDFFPPDLFCPEDVSVNAEPGTCDAFVFVDPLFVFDNCIDYYVENDYNSNIEFASDIYPVGTTIVTFTAFDLSGNVSICSTSITVNDVEAPEIICADGHFQNTDPGLCEAFVTVLSPVVNDNCPFTLSLVNDYNGTDNASGVYPAGDVTITWTATDNSGNTTSCNQTIMVFDNEAPNMVCQDYLLYLDANGQGSITAADIDGGSTDNCGFDNFTTIMPKTDFTTADLGANEVILMMWDLSGFSGECTATVTVVDTIPPTAICQDTTVYLNATGIVSIDETFIDDRSFDNGVIVLYEVDPSTFDCSNTGENIVTLTLTDDGGLRSSCPSTVTVLDTITPVVACRDTTVYLDENGLFSMDPAFIDLGSTDNCLNLALSLNISDFTCAESGDNTVVMTATDPSGNEASCSATVSVSDTISPNAICQQFTINLDINGDAFIQPTDIDDGSTDNCGIASMTAIPNSFTSTDLGDNVVTLSVEDVSGNISNCNAIVTVTDLVPPTAHCQDTTVYLDAAGTVSIDETYIDGGSFDNGIIVSMEVSPDYFDCSNVGANAVILTVVDEGGLTATCNSIVTVIDSIAPIIVCPNNIVQDIEYGTDDCMTEVDVPLATATDNCAISIIVNDYTGTDNASSEYPVGETQVFFTATDDSGNSSTCITLVTIISIEEFNCPADIVVEADTSSPGSCETFVSNPEPDFGLVCDVYEVFNDYTGTNDASSVYSIGLTTVTWTISINGVPVFTCEQTIEVVNSITSYLDCADDIIVDALPGDECNTFVSVPSPEWSVPCEIGVLTNNYTGTDDASTIYPSGTTLVTWTLAINGVPSFVCEQTVTVIESDNYLNCPADITQSTDPGVCEAFVSVPDPEYFGGCGFYNISNDYNSTNDASGIYPIGTTIVTWSLIDADSILYTCLQLITVTDIEAPIIVCNNLTITLDSIGLAYILPEDVDGGSTDNCGIASMTIDKNTFTSADIGENLVTLTVVDESGNAATCTAIITVDIIDAINEQELFDFSYYPNPNNGNFILTNRGANGGFLLELIDLTGKTVYSEKLELSGNTTKTVNANHLNKGVYLLKLTNTKDNFSRTLRMIIN